MGWIINIKVVDRDKAYKFNFLHIQLGPANCILYLGSNPNQWAVGKAPRWTCRVKFKGYYNLPSRATQYLGKIRRAERINAKITLNLFIRCGRQSGQKIYGEKEQINHCDYQPIQALSKTAIHDYPKISNHCYCHRKITTLPTPILNMVASNPNHHQRSFSILSLVLSYYLLPESIQFSSRPQNYPYTLRMEDIIANLSNGLTLTEEEACTIKADPTKLNQPINALVGCLAIQKFASTYDLEKGLRSAWDVKTPL